jgi:hypothetical protein
VINCSDEKNNQKCALLKVKNISNKIELLYVYVYVFLWL